MEVESNSRLIYHRVLLKLSGESLNGEQPSCFSMKAVSLLADEIKKLNQKKVQIAVVIGGGNIWRGRDASDNNISPIKADMIGMTATMLNAMVFQAVLEKTGLNVKIMSPLPLLPLIEPHYGKNAICYLEEGFIVLFAGGTGCPTFSTDTASALRAVEIGADIILKATTVDYVYNDDPRKNQDAVLYKTISYDKILQQKLRIIDETAAIICRNHKMPMKIFSIKDPKNLSKAISSEFSIGTMITTEEK